MKKTKNILFKSFAITSMASMSIGSFLSTSHLFNNNNVQYSSSYLKTNKSNKTKIFSSNWSKLKYAYDNRVFTTSDISKINTFSNKDVTSNSTIANSSSSTSPLYLSASNNGIYINVNNWASAINNINNLPDDAVGIEYEMLDPSQSEAVSASINKNNLSSWSDFYVYKQEIPGNFLSRKLSGVVTLNQAHWQTEINPWDQFSFVRGNSAYSAKNLSSAYPSINDKSLPIYSELNYTGESEGWKKASITFGVFDKKWWFTNAGSSISITYKNTDQISIDSFKQLSTDEMLEYFDITLNNTPTYCVSNGANNEDSSMSINFNDSLKRVEIKVSTPRRYSPKFVANSGKIDKQWITNDGMSKTLYVDYNNFKNNNTNVSSTIQQNGIQASGNIANYSSKEIADSLGTGDEGSSIYNNIVKFIYDNRNAIFNNWPSQSTGNDPKQFFKMSTKNSYELVSITSTSIKFKFSAKGFVDNGILTSTWRDKSFELLINGLPKASIGATSSINVTNAKSYFPNATTADSVSDSQIIEFLDNNNNKIIYNQYSGSTVMIDAIKRDQNTGEIIVEFHLDKYFDDEGNEVSNNLYLVTSLKGFDIPSSSFDLWMWLIIGGSALLVVIIVVLLAIIIHKKKNKRKNIKPKSGKGSDNTLAQSNRLSTSKKPVASRPQVINNQSSNITQQQRPTQQFQPRYNSQLNPQNNNRFTPQNPNMGPNIQRPVNQQAPLNRGPNQSNQGPRR